MDTGVCIVQGEPPTFKKGLTKRNCAFTKALRDRGIETHVVIPLVDSTTTVPEEFQEARLHTVEVSSASIANQLFRGYKVARTASKVAQKFDLTLQPGWSTLGAIVAVVHSGRMLLDVVDVSSEGSLYDDFPASKYVKKAIGRAEAFSANASDATVVVSEQMKQYVSREWNVPRSKVRVVRNGVDGWLFEQTFEDVSEVSGRVGFVGSLNHNIDYEKFFRIAERPEVSELHVVGTGSEFEWLTETVRRRDRSDITLHGFLESEQMYRVLASSQVCIAPYVDNGHTELSQHMKALEYGALRRAIVTDPDPTARLLEEQDGAVVPDTRNTEDFVDEVCTVLEDEGLRNRLSERAYRVASRYTWEKQGQKLADVYETL